jgi:hypothetical protein
MVFNKTFDRIIKKIKNVGSLIVTNIFENIRNIIGQLENNYNQRLNL